MATAPHPNILEEREMDRIVWFLTREDVYPFYTDKKPDDREAVEYIREAGCECPKVQLVWKPLVGPRCDLCGTQVVLVKRGPAY